MADTPTFDYLEVACDGRRATLTLNRPERLNALSAAVMAEVVAAADWFDHQPDLRVVVVAGAGRAFCAGFDIDTFAETAGPSPAGGRTAARHRPLPSSRRWGCRPWEESRGPERLAPPRRLPLPPGRRG